MARSVAELLHRPFAELELDDVRQIIASLGEQRESLFFERKAQVNANSLAKACAAFANAHGGLLVVGVGDDDDELVGIDPRHSEAQLWVKDVLRNHVLPMPPFRARWLPTATDRGLLLVLVEESATTPHILTRNGVIYVRNSGSSDPVADQRRLLDLVARGERAAEHAQEAARSALSIPFSGEDDRLGLDWRPIETLVLAATGVSTSFEEALFRAETPEALSTAMWGECVDRPRDQERRIPLWKQHHVGVRRSHTDWQAYGIQSIEEAFLLTRDGVVVVTRGFVSQEDRDPGSAREERIEPYFAQALAAARDVLTAFGAHGDLRLVYRLDVAERDLYLDSYQSGPHHFDEPLLVELDTTFEDETAEQRVFAEVARACGCGPRS